MLRKLCRALQASSRPPPSLQVSARSSQRLRRCNASATTPQHSPELWDATRPAPAGLRSSQLPFRLHLPLQKTSQAAICATEASGALPRTCFSSPNLQSRPPPTTSPGQPLLLRRSWQLPVIRCSTIPLYSFNFYLGSVHYHVLL